MRPFFLISSPRSGSTWTRTVLNAHPEVACSELRLYGDFCEVWVDDPQTRVARPRFTLDRVAGLMAGYAGWGDATTITRRLAEALLTLVRQESGRQVVVDKITPYLGSAATVVAGIQRDFPEAGVVFLERDGRDVMTSGVFHWLRRRRAGQRWGAIEKARYAYFMPTGTVGTTGTATPPAALPRLFTPADIDFWGRQWLGPALHAAPIAGCTLRYEQMIADPEAAFLRLFRFLGVAEDRACIAAGRFERMSGGRRPGETDPARPDAMVRSGTVGDWRRWFTRSDGAAFQALAGTVLQARGFETDPHWYDMLPEQLDPALCLRN